MGAPLILAVNPGLAETAVTKVLLSWTGSCRRSASVRVPLNAITLSGYDEGELTAVQAADEERR